ncbi:MAG: response regulator [Pseudomonadota bacterium]
MGFYRQTPPEYRALVVENEREFRNDLVYTVESMDIGISVVAEASDFDDALSALETEDIDLLITDINLTDEPRFVVGEDDGTALASIAHERYDIPAIFLTAFAEYDPAVVAKATESEPIGFIQKHGGSVGIQIQQLIRLALRRMELVRREREGRLQLEAVFQRIGEALIFVDSDGYIIDFNEGACELLAYNPDALIDQHWEDAVSIDTTDPTQLASLKRLIEQCENARLPSIALRTQTGGSVLCSLQLLSVEHRREPCILLLLSELSSDTQAPRIENVAVGASFLAIGLSCNRLQRDFDANLLRLAMLDLRANTIARCRPGDVVLRPQNATLGVVMPSTDEGTAFVLARTLLDTVHQDIQARLPTVDIRGGLSFRAAHKSENATVAGAIDALDRAQHGSRERVLTATGSFTPRDINAKDPIDTETQTIRQTRLDVGFQFASQLLDIAPDRISGYESLIEEIDQCAFKSGMTLAYGLAARSPEGILDWHEVRTRADYLGEAEEPVLFDSGVVRNEVLGHVGNELKSPVFINFEGYEFFLLPLWSDGEQVGLGFAARDLKLTGKATPISDGERQLAQVISDHLGRLFVQAISFDASSSEAIEGPGEYNLYSLASEMTEQSELELLLKLDSPIALVGEAGLARTDLMRQAVSTCALDSAVSVAFYSGNEWRDSNRKDEFDSLLRSSVNKLLLMRDPHRMHPELQQQFARAIRSRVTGILGSEQALLPMRFAVTLPKKPEAMVNARQLVPELASAFGAGVVQLEPLRLSSTMVLKWARRVLQAESAAQGRTGIRFTSEAEIAIQRHSWPGNLMELQDRVRSAVDRFRGPMINEVDLGLFQLKSVETQAQSHPLEAAGLAEDAATRVKIAISEVLAVGVNLSEPPAVLEWLEHEVVNLTLNRFSRDRNPSVRSADFLKLSRNDLDSFVAKAGYSAASRHDAAYWQNTRLALTSWLEEYGGFEDSFEDVLKPMLLEAVPTEYLSDHAQQLERMIRSTFQDVARPY